MAWPNQVKSAEEGLGISYVKDSGEGNGLPLQSSCLENPMDRGAWWAAVHEVAKSWTRLSDFTFTFCFHALEKETATHASVLDWRIPGTGEPGGLPSMGSHRVGHDWSDSAAAAAACQTQMSKTRISWAVLYLVAQSCPTLWTPWFGSSPGSSVHGDSQGKNTRVGCHALLQGIFPPQGSNPSLPHCR